MSTRATIDDLKNVMIMSGQMSELHYHNLQQWGRVVFNNYDSIEITYNINTTDPKTYNKLTDNELDKLDKTFIHYSVKPIQGKRITKVRAEKAMDSLVKWIGDIFWNDIEVYITIGKKEYKGTT